jgi:two-component system, sensor histidine kinase RegB
MSAPITTQAGFKLLLRLRWAALGAYTLGCFGAVFLLKVPLHWSPVSACLLALAFANLVAEKRIAFLLRRPEVWAAFLQTLDVIAFTFLLLWTGGAYNPFAIFYLLHVVVACAMLRSRSAIGLLLLCVGCYSYLLLAAQPLPLSESLGFHHLGMILAMTLTAGGIIYFFTRLNRDRVAHEAALEQARIASERTRRMASVSTLAAGVAHALATPIGTIALISEEMQQRSEMGLCDSETLKDILEIRREVGVCASLLRKISAKGAGSEGEAWRDVGVEEVMVHCLGQLEPEEKACVLRDAPIPTSQLQAPFESLVQALIILLRNGLQASVAHGKILFGCHEFEGFVVWTVADRGEGMSPQQLDQVGEPFFSTRKTGNNLGLGLFIVRSLAEQMRGELTFDSQLGLGTVAKLKLAVFRDGEKADWPKVHGMKA